MKYISVFESSTGAKLKDCIVDEENKRVIFIVSENDMGKAIGKNGVNIRKLERLIRKRIKAIEFNEDVSRFIQNYLYPLKVREVVNEDSIITIKGNDTKTRGMIIGRDSRNLNRLKDIVNRYFEVKDIKVV